MTNFSKGLEWLKGAQAGSPTNSEVLLERQIADRLARLSIEFAVGANDELDKRDYLSGFIAPGKYYRAEAGVKLKAADALGSITLYSRALKPLIQAIKDNKFQDEQALLGVLLQSILRLREELQEEMHFRTRAEASFFLQALSLNLMSIMQIPAVSLHCVTRCNDTESRHSCLLIQAFSKVILCDFEQALRVTLEESNDEAFSPMIAALTSEKVLFLASGGELSLSPKSGRIVAGELELEQEIRSYKLSSDEPIELNEFERNFEALNEIDLAPTSIIFQ